MGGKWQPQCDHCIFCQKYLQELGLQTLRQQAPGKCCMCKGLATGLAATAIVSLRL